MWNVKKHFYKQDRNIHNEKKQNKNFGYLKKQKPDPFPNSVDGETIEYFKTYQGTFFYAFNE